MMSKHWLYYVIFTLILAQDSNDLSAEEKKRGRRDHCDDVVRLFDDYQADLQDPQLEPFFTGLFLTNAPIIQIGEYCSSNSPGCCINYPTPESFYEQNAGLQSRWTVEQVVQKHDDRVVLSGEVWIHYPEPVMRSVVSSFSLLWVKQKCQFKIAGLTMISVACNSTINRSCASCGYPPIN